MLAHIVFFSLKDQADGKSKPELAKELEQRLKSLPEKIDQIKKFEIGQNLSNSPNAFDMALYSYFENQDALQEYRVHPAHQEVVDYLKIVSEKMAVVDYNL